PSISQLLLAFSLLAAVDASATMSSGKYSTIWSHSSSRVCSNVNGSARKRGSCGPDASADSRAAASLDPSEDDSAPSTPPEHPANARTATHDNAAAPRRTAPERKLKTTFLLETTAR